MATTVRGGLTLRSDGTPQRGDGKPATPQHIEAYEKATETKLPKEAKEKASAATAAPAGSQAAAGPDARSVLKTFTLTQLREQAKRLNVTGYSTMKEEELIEAIVSPPAPKPEGT